MYIIKTKEITFSHCFIAYKRILKKRLLEVFFNYSSSQYPVTGSHSVHHEIKNENGTFVGGF